MNTFMRMLVKLEAACSPVGDTKVYNDTMLCLNYANSTQCVNDFVQFHKWT
jgi:hypothetical protein